MNKGSGRQEEEREGEGKEIDRNEGDGRRKDGEEKKKKTAPRTYVFVS